MVPQSDLDGIGSWLECLELENDLVRNEYIYQGLIADILKITGREEFDIKQKSEEHQSRKDAGESFDVSPESLDEYCNSLDLFTWARREPEEDEEDGGVSDDDGDDAIHTSTWIQRWDKEEPECEIGGRVLWLKRSVLNKKLQVAEE